jgi:hypothetical protein
MIVAEEHKIFTHDLHRQWRVSRQLFRERYRMPVASHKISARSSRTGLSDQVVFFVGKHGIIFDFGFSILIVLNPLLLLSLCRGGNNPMHKGRA